MRGKERGAIGRLSCCTSGRMMLKIHCAPALFREQEETESHRSQTAKRDVLNEIWR